MDGLVNDDDDDEEDEEFVRRLQELALELQDSGNNIENGVPDSRNQETETTSSVSPLSSVGNGINPPWPASCPEPPKWDEIVLAGVEINANRADLPLSLRIIKKKKQWEDGVKEAGESARCSIKKAFSSMVFIVRELQSYTLQLREVLLYENLQGIWAKVQGEMNASFVWLFQQIFSCTPTLMVYVMLLLANFTVYSISQNLAIAALSPNPPVAVEHEYKETQQNTRFDASSIKSFSVGRTTSVGGSGGGGGKVKPVAGAIDDGRSDGSYTSYGQKIIPADGISSAGVEGPETAAMEEEEQNIWHRIVEEVYRMQVSLRGETLMDSDTLHQLVSPVSAELEPEDLALYLRTELTYHHALSQDPDNVLLLSNFAQFLFLVFHDHDR